MTTTVIKIRRDTSTNWNIANPILADGELGYETDTTKMKCGDGATTWQELIYISVGDAQYAAVAGTAGTAGSATTAGTVTNPAQGNITSVGTLTNLAVTGNITAANVTASGVITGNGAGLTNLNAANIVGSLPTSTTAVTVTANAQPNITSVGQLTGLTSTGQVNITNTTPSTNKLTGALTVNGGIATQGNIHTNEVHSTGPVFAGNFADQAGIITDITNPVFVGFRGGNNYVQGVVKNSLGSGSADWTAFANEGSDTQGWISQGITGTTFNDPEYPITGPGDGYLFSKGLTGYGGNLVFATGQTGSCNDIVFATGGFNTTNIFGKIECQNNTFKLTRANSSITFNDNTKQTTAWTGNVPIANVTGIGNIASTNLDGSSSNVLYGNGVFAPVTGGGLSTVLPYVELTNTPFITQPAVSGEDVVISAAPAGNNARFDVVIGEGPVIESVTVSQAGTGYTVGQKYKIWYYDIGGNNNDSSIEFEIAEVDENGGVVAVDIVVFTGESPTNTPGTYTNRSVSYQPSVFDNVDTGLTLTRSNYGALFNSNAESEYNDNTYISPVGTLWNSDGWGNLLNLASRNWSNLRSTLDNRIGNNIVGAELVMWDTINNKFYKFSFSEWGQNGIGSYAYTRNLITDPNVFVKTNYGDEVDEISEGLHITRGDQGWLYNPLEESGSDDDTPTNSVWNNGGWDDLSDVESRTYRSLADIWGGNFRNIPGAKMVMKDTTTDKYWAIEFLSWTDGNNGGGFSYTRRELDVTKLNEGVKFADGTVQKTAYVETNVKSTAPGGRRIEEVTGYSEVTVEEVSTIVTFNSTTIERPEFANSWDIYINLSVNPEIEAAIGTYGEYSSSTSKWQLTINDQTYNNDNIRVYISGSDIVIYSGDNNLLLPGDSDISFTLRRVTNPQPQRWFRAEGSNLRGAIIDFHAYSQDAGTIIGTIHIARDDGDYNITHTETSSGSSDLSNVDMWYRDGDLGNERDIFFRRLDGEGDTLKVQWIAKLFYGSEYYD
jgi:hypothetical protein